jgi:hypothetical protein
MNELDVRILAPGAAIGPAAVLDEPLSLWGGLDPATGLLTDPHHPQHGMSLTRRVVVMPGGRGSSSSSSVLAEAVRAGVAPAAFVLFELDLILAIGCRSSSSPRNTSTGCGMARHSRSRPRACSAGRRYSPAAHEPIRLHPGHRGQPAGRR